MVLESTGETNFKMMLSLLKSLWKSAVITMDQMKRVSMIGRFPNVPGLLFDS